MFALQNRVLGNDFYNKVCGHLKLLEKEYFGLEFRHACGSYVSVVWRHTSMERDQCAAEISVV